MKLFYNASNTNFGDHLNAWLWPRLIPELLEREDDIRLVGIGSLLKADLDRLAGRKVIFGTGSGYGRPPAAEIAGRWSVHAVRGPLTARQYGFAPETAITDGAWLIDLLPEYAARTNHTGGQHGGQNGGQSGEDAAGKGGGTIFVPHWTSAEYGNWKPAAALAGIGYVDPLDDGPSVLDRIARADLAIVESLHGAIFADYFRTPWIPVASAGRVLHFKWLDWCQSLDVDYRSYPLPPSDLTDALVQGLRPSHDMPELRARTYSPEDFRYDAVTERRGAGPLYRARTRAKSVARAARGAALDFLGRHRDGLGMQRWNDTHREALAEYLTRLAGENGALSGDAIRARRLQQLAEALERMRRDPLGSPVGSPAAA